MLSKLSNTASRTEIESYVGASYRYKFLYQPQCILKGNEEVSLSIVTSDKPGHIEFGIWGILPTNYEEDWKYFQYAENTLSINFLDIHKKHWLFDALKSRRCLIIVTGYFKFQIKNNILNPVFVSNKDSNLFYLAGIFNYTVDGFITCSVLTGISSYLPTPDVLTPELPLVLSQKEGNAWLNDDFKTGEPTSFLSSLRQNFLSQIDIDPELFKKDKITSQMLRKPL